MKQDIQSRDLEKIKNPFSYFPIQEFEEDNFKKFLSRFLFKYSRKKKIRQTQIVILAAGKGSRMNIDYPKPLYKLNYPDGNFNMLENTLKNIDVMSKSSQMSSINIVINEKDINYFESYQVKNKINLILLHPKKINGTAACVNEIIPFLNKEDDVLFIWGDLAIWDPSDFSLFLSAHKFLDSKVTFPTRIVKNPYVAFLRDCDGKLSEVFHSNEGKKYYGLAEQDCLAFAFQYKVLKHLPSFLNDFHSMNQEVDLVHFLPYLSLVGVPVMPLPICNQKSVSGLNNQKKAREINKTLEKN